MIGSQALHATFDTDLPAVAQRSIEVDVAIFGDRDGSKADIIDGSIGIGMDAVTEQLFRSIRSEVPHGGLSWDKCGTWHPLPYIDSRAAELLFRQKVIAFLAGENLLDDDRVELLDSWKSGHTGFSAHKAVTVAADDGVGLEHLRRTRQDPSRAPPCARAVIATLAS